MQATESRQDLGFRWVRGIQLRYTVLIGLLAIGVGLLAVVDEQAPARAPRWPREDALYAVDGWRVTPATVDVPHPGSPPFITRRYVRPGVRPAQLTFSTSPDAKSVYRAGGDVPFLGTGYVVEPAPATLVPPASGRTAIIIRRESEVGLVLYAYGERRGLLGNGPLAWGFVGLDAVLGRPNDYVKMSLIAPLDGLDSPAVQAAVSLADTVFPRLAAWYDARS
jgi:hypothetical protein